MDLDKIRLIETNSALGYMEVAYLIQINEKEMLCVYSNEEGYVGDHSWVVGEVYDMFEYESDYDEVINDKKEMVLKDSPLYGDFLFDFFLKHLIKNKLC